MAVAMLTMSLASYLIHSLQAAWHLEEVQDSDV